MHLNKREPKFVKASAVYTPGSKRRTWSSESSHWILHHISKLIGFKDDRTVQLNVRITGMSNRIIQYDVDYTIRTPSISNTNVALSGIKLPLATRLFK